VASDNNLVNVWEAGDILKNKKMIYILQVVLFISISFKFFKPTTEDLFYKHDVFALNGNMDVGIAKIPNEKNNVRLFFECCGKINPKEMLSLQVKTSSMWRCEAKY
jgi:hypothetical protein